MDAIFAIPVLGAAYKTLSALPAQYPAMTASVTAMYLSGLVGMNMIGAYNDALAAVLTHRQAAKRAGGKTESEWDAARSGARSNGWRRLVQSVVWPATLAMDIVPSLVLYIHRERAVNTIRSD
jgi:hypothetical protein